MSLLEDRCASTTGLDDDGTRADTGAETSPPFTFSIRIAPVSDGSDLVSVRKIIHLKLAHRDERCHHATAAAYGLLQSNR